MELPLDPQNNILKYVVNVHFCFMSSLITFYFISSLVLGASECVPVWEASGEQNLAQSLPP